MLDRIATSAVSLQRESQMQRMQTQLNKLTYENASGLIENPAGALGTGASALYQLHIDSDQQAVLQTSITSAGQRINSMQTALSSMTDMATQMSVAALNSASDSGSGMNVLAAQARSALAQMTDLLNTQYNGHAVFAGTDSAGTPMADSGTMSTAAQNILTDHVAANAGVALTDGDVTALVNGTAGAPGITNFFTNTAATSVIVGTPSATFTYNVDNTALSNVHVQLTDSTGKVVGTMATAGTTGSATFDGTDGAGNTLPAGTYAASLVGTDSSGLTQPAGQPAANFTGSAFTAIDDGQKTKVMISETTTTSYDVKANQPGFRDMMQALTMLGLLDQPSTQLDDTAKTALLTQARGLISKAQTEIATTAGILGTTQQRLDQASTIQQSAANATSKQILDLEQVDPYTAAQQLSALQTQLQATYAITASISKLGLVNYIS